VLDNLLINAIKFSQSQTQVTITLSRDEYSVFLTVEDQGQGIPANDLEKIFMPFSHGQVKSTHGEPSTGLGLAIVRRIIEGHGGRVSVTSKINQGTVFRIQLPIASR
jgi:signal transduction histidine kinase